jgi:hypothetical protein
MPRPLGPPDPPVEADVRPYLGSYERTGWRLEVYEGEAGPMLRNIVTGPLAAVTPEPVRQYPLVPVREGLFVVREPAEQTWMPVTFYGLPTGERFAYSGLRVTPKVA